MEKGRFLGHNCVGSVRVPETWSDSSLGDYTPANRQAVTAFAETLQELADSATRLATV